MCSPAAAPPSSTATPYELRPGDFLRLPPGTTHGFITRDEPLVMLDIHAPGSRPDHDVFFVGEVPEGFGTVISHRSTVNSNRDARACRHIVTSLDLDSSRILAFSS